MTRGFIGGVLGALLVAAAPGSAQTNGYLLPCSAAGALSRGCTTLTTPADASTMLANPAGLSGIAGRTLEVDGAAFLPTMTYANAVNQATDGKHNVFPLPAVFFAERLGPGWSFGAGMQTMGGMGADYTLANAVLGPGQRYHSKFALMKGGVAVAYRPVRQLSIGAVAGALYSQLEMATPYAVDPAQLAGMAGLGQIPEYRAMMSGFSEAVAYASITGLSAVGFTAGASVQYEPSSDLAFALMWTAPTTLRMGGGTATMDMNAQFNQLYGGMVAASGGNSATVRTQLSGFGLNLGTGMTTAFDAKADFGVPQTATLAAGGRLSERLRAGADVEWIGWAHAFRDMPLTLTNGTSANVNILMNGQPSNGAFSTAWPLNWKDTWVGRAGVAYQATPDLSFSAGGIYGSDPVPGNTLFTIFPAIVQGAATAGVGYRVGSAELHLAYAHTFAHSQTGAPTSLVASEYANGTSTLAEHTISVGLGWKF
ncbi:MAG: outer membrane protein transport protein [Gemmatimonadota bacterium]|nr:outer membrane protein transport protein [Gemmatimonadota bacterium]